jgi:hypothetical protein
MMFGGALGFVVYSIMNFKENKTPYHKGAVLGSGGGSTPSYAAAYSPHGSIGGKYVEVDSRLAQRVSEQIEKEKPKVKGGGVKKETEDQV